jgi:hypothetical protein
LRTLIPTHQKQLYKLHFRASAGATQQLARDPQRIGGKIGMVGVLHTWGRNLIYYPHVHYLIPAGGRTEQGMWRATTHNFLLPSKRCLGSSAPNSAMPFVKQSGLTIYQPAPGSLNGSCIVNRLAMARPLSNIWPRIFSEWPLATNAFSRSPMIKSSFVFAFLIQDNAALAR